MSVINRLNSRDQGFDEQLTQLLAYDEAQDSQIESAVSEILANVRERGDAAVVEYSRKFDGVSAEHMAELEVSKEACEAALAALPAEQRDALTQAAKRIRAYHERQKSTGWTYEGGQGCLSFFCADECDSGQGCGRWGSRHGHAYARWRAKSYRACCGCSGRCGSCAYDRRCSGGGGVSLWYREYCTG